MGEFPWGNAWRSKRRATYLAKPQRVGPARANGLLTSVWYREMWTLLCMDTFASPRNGPWGGKRCLWK
jgi:hypothetical protein